MNYLKIREFPNVTYDMAHYFFSEFEHAGPNHQMLLLAMAEYHERGNGDGPWCQKVRSGTLSSQIGLAYMDLLVRAGVPSWRVSDIWW